MSLKEAVDKQPLFFYNYDLKSAPGKPGTNPLLGGAMNASQGNSSTANDNSTTSLIVITAIVTPVELLSSQQACEF